MKSIRTRLSFFLLLAAVLAAVVIGIATYKNTLRENEELFDYQLRQIALSLRDQGLAAGPGLLQDGNDGALDVVVQIWTNSGAVLYLSRPGNPLFDRVTLGFTDIDAGAKRWRAYGLAARDRVIQVAQPLELRRDLAAAAALRSLAPLLAFAPIMALLIWWLVGDALLAVTRLASEVGQRDARSLDEVSEAGVPTEITPLVRALNVLLDKLKRALTSQRAFVADAAHELRSPLTALKLQLQLLDRAPDEAARLHALGKLHEGVDRATRLIQQLLTAARTDPNDASLSFQEIDLTELVRHTIAEVFAFAQERRVGIELDAPDRLTIAGDADALRILVRNLLDNAIRYSHAAGALLVSMSAGTGKAVLTIEDAGPGIPESERLRVFDRFYRRQQNEQSGSGLGLAIVKNIAQQHGADIELGTSRFGGLKVCVTFCQRDAPLPAPLPLLSGPH